METSLKLKIGLTSVVALGCAGVAYLVLRNKTKEQNAADVLDLSIKIITTEKECEEVISNLRRYF